MQIYIARGDQKLGPFPEQEVRAKLQTGEFSPGDLAWAEGSPNWVSLSSLLGTDAPLPPRLPTAAPIGPSQTSGLAVTSLVLGILSCSIIPLLPAIPAVICGHIAKSKIRASSRGYG